MSTLPLRDRSFSADCRDGDLARGLRSQGSGAKAMGLASSICCFFVLIAPEVNGRDRVTLAVSPAQSFAPSRVRIRARVEPHVGNRGLAVIAESGEFYRRSDIQLDGDRSPATIVLEFPGLPDYEVVALLVDSAGRERVSARATLNVIAAGGR